MDSSTALAILENALARCRDEDVRRPNSSPLWIFSRSRPRGNSQILFGAMGRLSENSVLNLKNKSHSVTAEIVVPEKPVEGVIIAQGGNIGGWSL